MTLSDNPSPECCTHTCTYTYVVSSILPRRISLSKDSTRIPVITPSAEHFIRQHEFTIDIRLSLGTRRSVVSNWRLEQVLPSTNFQTTTHYRATGTAVPMTCERPEGLSASLSQATGERLTNYLLLRLCLGSKVLLARLCYY